MGRFPHFPPLLCERIIASDEIAKVRSILSQSLAQPSQKNCTLQDACAIIAQHDRILIVSHARPDGDCLGSTVALMLGLQSLGKQVAAYNASPITDKWAYLAGVEHVANNLPVWEPELTIFVDCGAVYRVSDDFSPIGTTLNIDHHLTNERYGDYNLIDIEACSVGEQIAQVLDQLGATITREIATAIYLSIMTDTGSFRYEGTSERCFLLAARLVSLGVDPSFIAKAVYESKERGEFVLTARAFEHLHLEFDGYLAWSELRREDYAAAGGYDMEPEGLSSELRSIRGVEISCLVHEMDDGTTRVNFRGKGGIDCSALAKSCGGGGHFNASGASLKDMSYEAAKEKILTLTRDAVARQLRANGTLRESS